MAENPPIKVDLDLEAFLAASVRARRHLASLALGVELASRMDPAQVSTYLAEFAVPTKGREAQDLRWIQEHTPDWERMVIDGLAWLVAAQEYTAAIKATQKTEDPA